MKDPDTGHRHMSTGCYHGAQTIAASPPSPQPRNCTAIAPPEKGERSPARGHGTVLDSSTTAKSAFLSTCGTSHSKGCAYPPAVIPSSSSMKLGEPSKSPNTEVRSEVSMSRSASSHKQPSNLQPAKLSHSPNSTLDEGNNPSTTSAPPTAPPPTPPVQPLVPAPPYYYYWYPVPVGYWYCVPYWVYPPCQPWGWVPVGYCLPVYCYQPLCCFPVACNCQMCASEASQQKMPWKAFQQCVCEPSLNEATCSSPIDQPSTCISPLNQPSNEASFPFIQPINEASSPLIQPSNEASSPLIQPLNEASSPLIQLSNEASSPLNQPSNEASSHLNQPSNEASSPLIQPSNEASSPLNQPSNEAINQPSNEASSPLNQPSNEASSHLNQPSNEASSPLIQLSNEASSPLNQPSNEASSPLDQPSNEASSPLNQPSNEASSPLNQPSNKASSHLIQPSNVASSPLNQPSNEASSHLIQPSNEASSPLNQPSNEATCSLPLNQPLIEAGPPLVDCSITLSPHDSLSQSHTARGDSVPEHPSGSTSPDTGGSLTQSAVINAWSSIEHTSCGRGYRYVISGNKHFVHGKMTKRTYSLSLNQASYRDVLSFGRIPLLLRVCVVMIALLLLLAGDVERNPGPVDRLIQQRSESTDSEEFFDAVESLEHRPGFKVVTVERVAELAALLDEMAAYWNLFLGQLGVPQGKLDQIQLQSVGQPNVAQYCLTRGLHHWVISNDSPTFERIIAILNGDFLTNKPLARRVEEFTQNVEIVPHASTADGVISGYADQMRGYYRTSIPQCFSLTWPPPPTRKVFNLSMIRHDQYNYGRGNDELVRLLYLGSVDEVMKSKKELSVKLEDLFHLDKAKRKIILIEGAPGAGKSTLAWHICQMWETGELFQEFKLVVFVQLRDPAIQSAKSVADLFPAHLKSLAREVVSRMETKGGEGLLFLLDGWDEFPPGLRGNELIKNLICNPSAIAMPSSTLLITSRPIASGDLHPYASSRVETIGFKEAEVKLYFKESLKSDSEKIEKLEDCLKERPVVKASCYLPLNAVIVIHLFLSLDSTLPNTLHGVFLQLVIHCIFRHLIKQQDVEPPHISSLDDLPQDMQTQLSHICAMAYHGVMENKVTFSEHDLKYFNLPPDISTLSLIQGVVSFMPYRLRSYNFLHLSVQELLASNHISKLPPEEQVKIFKELFGQPRFAAVFQYYAAFTKLQTAGIEDVMVSIIQRGDKLILLTLLNCLYEAQDPSMCKFVASELKGELDLAGRPLSPVDCIAVGYFLHQCANICPMTAKLSDCSVGSCELELLGKELKRPIQTIKFGVYIDLCSNRFDGNLTQSIARELIASANENTSGITISKLSLSGNPVQDSGEDGLSHLCQALATNTSLVELNLRNCSLHEACGPALCHMLETNKTLTSLDLSDNHFPIFSHNVVGVAKGLKNNHSLKCLKLSWCQLRDGMESLADCLLVNDSLEELQLNGNTISPEAAYVFCDVLKRKRTLKKLNVSGCRLPDEALRSLAFALEVNSSLEELSLNGNIISLVAARDFSGMLKHNRTLKKLIVSYCRLTDEKMKPLASALEANTTLEELDLSYNSGLTDAALVTLGEILKRNTGLKRLRIVLYDTLRTVDYWRQFVQCLEDNHSLELLETFLDSLDVEGVNTVRRINKHPELQHETYVR